MIRRDSRRARAAVALGMCLLVLSGLAIAPSPARSASANLVWKPFLQQLGDTSVIIQWSTHSGANSLVRFSADTSYAGSVAGSTRSLSALGTQLHRAHLTGLEPNTAYFYKIFTGDEDLLPDQELRFRTAPPRGSSTPFTFLAFGDYGNGAAAQFRLRDQMLRESPHFIVTTGDNAYPNGAYGDFDSKVFQVYGDLFSRAGVFPTMGNHDYHTSSGAPYLGLFDLPRNTLRSADRERYYSFDFGNVHFVALDTNKPLDATDSSATDDMFDWLRDDLSRTNQRWKIAIFHHAGYSAGSHGSDSRVQSKLLPILEQYGVQLVLTGHDHSYQRSKPMLNGQVTTTGQGGVVHIVSGAGSAASYGCSSASWLQIAFCSKSYGLYNRVTVSGDYLTIEAVSESGLVRDMVSLGQPPATPVQLPGRIEVERYRPGGPNIGYQDSTSGNTGGQYRLDDVDIQTCSDGPGCYNVGWIVPGEWLAYDVDLAQSGSYVFSVRAATPGNDKKLRIAVDGVDVAGLNIPNTGSHQTWASVASPPIELAAGPHTVRITSESNSFNLNYVDVAPADGTTPTPTSTPTPSPTPEPTPSPSPSPSPSPEPTTLTFAASADARVEERYPNSNYGSSTAIRADGASDPDVESFLRFEVTGASGTIQSARVRIYSTSSTADGPALFPAAPGWTEQGITWNKRPARSGPALADTGRILSSKWVEFDVSPAVTGDGSYSFVLATDTTDGVSFSSREGGSAPELVITLAP